MNSAWKEQKLRAAGGTDALHTVLNHAWPGQVSTETSASSPGLTGMRPDYFMLASARTSSIETDRRYRIS
jgi:hypothetical protein